MKVKAVPETLFPFCRIHGNFSRDFFWQVSNQDNIFNFRESSGFLCGYHLTKVLLFTYIATLMCKIRDFWIMNFLFVENSKICPGTFVKRLPHEDSKCPLWRNKYKENQETLPSPFNCGTCGFLRTFAEPRLRHLPRVFPLKYSGK